VRQNPIQRTVSLFICVCIALCRIVAHNIAQNRPDSFPPYPPDNHHCSDDVYLREGGNKVSSKCSNSASPLHSNSRQNLCSVVRIRYVSLRPSMNALIRLDSYRRADEYSSTPLILSLAFFSHTSSFHDVSKRLAKNTPTR